MSDIKRSESLYLRRLNSLFDKIEKDNAEQDQADYDAYIKRQENQAFWVNSVSIYNTITQARMSAPTLKMQETYGDFALDQKKKYEMREGGELKQLNPFGEDFAPGEFIGKEVKKFVRPLEETEGYKEFQALEETGVDEEMAPIEAVEEVATEVDPLTLSTGKIVEDPSAEYDIDIIKQKIEDNMATSKELAAQKGFSISDPEYEKLSNEKFELRQQLDYIKTFSPEELEEIKLKESERLLLLEEESAERFYAEDPITGEEIVPAGKISPTDYTVKSPDDQLRLKREQAGFDLEQLTTEEEALNIDPITGQPLPVRGEISPTDYTVGRLSSEQQLQLKREQAGFDLEQLTTEADILEMENKGFRFNPMTDQFEPIAEVDPAELERVRAELAAAEAAEAARGAEISQTIDPITGETITAPGKISPTDYTVKRPDDQLRLSPVGKTRYISEIDIEAEDLDLSRMTPGLPESVGAVPELAGPEGAPIVPGAEIIPDVEIPDAEPGFMSKGFGATKKLGTMENIQNVYSLYNIGQTIGDKGATSEEKGVATVQATKLLADLAAKHGKEATVGQIGSKAASDYFAKKGLQEGVKLGGKQAVGAAAGGVLGGYTMVTEGKEAAESWEEGDYDEAILHGIGSVSGGLQTAGAGMMLTGVGAPLGAVLYGVGTAGSVISSVGGFIEGLFGDDEPAPEVQKQRPRRSRLRRYYGGIMNDDTDNDYLSYRR